MLRAAVDIKDPPTGSCFLKTFYLLSHFWFCHSAGGKGGADVTCRSAGVFWCLLDTWLLTSGWMAEDANDRVKKRLRTFHCAAPFSWNSTSRRGSRSPPRETAGLPAPARPTGPAWGCRWAARRNSPPHRRSSESGRGKRGWHYWTSQLVQSHRNLNRSLWRHENNQGCQISRLFHYLCSLQHLLGRNLLRARGSPLHRHSFTTDSIKTQVVLAEQIST